MPKQQSRRIAARHHELARRKKTRQHSDASAVAEPGIAAAVASPPAPAAATTPAPVKSNAAPVAAKGPRQILTPDVRHLKSDFRTLVLLTSIVVVVLVVLKVLENQGILLR